ncbi:hypothetical protein LINGRAHAP2_LOCUS7717 [Linum grandiflorum]
MEDMELHLKTMLNYDIVLLIGLAIGATPFISIHKDIKSQDGYEETRRGKRSFKRLLLLTNKGAKFI